MPLSSTSAEPVTYDSRSFMLHGARTLLMMGEVHYARSPRALWPALLDRSVACGLNSIASYIFWNWHEPARDRYEFSGDHDLGYFLSLCAERGLHVLLRMGPYCCAEWNYGGYPAWLREEPEVVIRTWNTAYLRRVEKYFRHLCAEVTPYLATNGGPVILAQVENEYANVAKRYGEGGQRYLAWMAELARTLGIDVPILMCEGAAPGVIETVNGHVISEERAAEFRRHYPELPMIWTELWPAWYDTWGFQRHLRDARNIAWNLLRFVSQGGAGWNYYMWHGGTNFARNSMYLQTTSYDFDAPLDEYGAITRKGAYLGRLHRVLAEHAPALLGGERTQESNAAGRNITTWSYAGETLRIERDAQGYGRLLDARGQVLFDTEADYMETARVHPVRTWEPAATPREWRHWREPFPAACAQDVVRAAAPIEQLALTHDATDYCWYSTTVELAADGEHLLDIAHGGDFFYLFLDGAPAAQSQPPFHENRGQTAPGVDAFIPANDLEKLVQDGFHHTFRFSVPAGRRRLDILAVALGLVKGDWSISGSMQTERKGIWDTVSLDGQPLAGWEMRPGLTGEADPIAYHPGLPATTSACTWYSARFTLAAQLLAAGAEFRLDAEGLGKGMLFINGHALGRHWLLAADGYGADEPWQQSGEAGLSIAPREESIQRYYHIPRCWLGEENVLSIFEEQARLPAAVRVQARR